MVTIEQLFRQAQQAGAAEIYLMAGQKTGSTDWWKDKESRLSGIKQHRSRKNSA